MTPLSQASKQRLAQLDQARQEARSASVKQHHKQRAASAAQQLREQKLCSEARQKHHALQLKRRKGYTLAESARIGRLTEESKDAIRLHC